MRNNPGFFLLLISILSVQSSLAQTKTSSRRDPHSSLISSILRSAPVIDGHNDLYGKFFACSACPRGVTEYRIDTISTGQTDIPRWRKGGVGGVLLNVHGNEKSQESYLRAWDLLYQIQQAYQDEVRVVGTSTEMKRAMKENKIALLPSLEAAIMIEDDPMLLRMHYRLGLRSVTLAYHTNKLADGSNDTARYNGLSAEGRAMIKEMNRLGIIIDLSHISADAMSLALDETNSPVIFSHSNARAVCDVNRNVPDSILLRLKKNGGIIMLTPVPYFVSKKFNEWMLRGDELYYSTRDKFPGNEDTLNLLMQQWEEKDPMPEVSISDLGDHFDYVKNLIGVDHIGIGGDYDGISFTIKEMSDVSTFPKLLKELLKRGWTESELKKITSENFLRVFEAVESQSSTTPLTN